MLLSKACIYGVRSSLYLAVNQGEEYVSIKEISEKLDISFHFLTKVLQDLSRTGLMESQKGPKGGVRLSRPSSELCLFKIVEAIDGTDLFTECVLGLKGCGTQKPCPMHEKWGEKRDDIQEMLKSTTLLELVEKGKAGNLRITSKGDFGWE